MLSYCFGLTCPCLTSIGPKAFANLELPECFKIPSTVLEDGVTGNAFKDSTKNGKSISGNYSSFDRRYGQTH